MWVTRRLITSNRPQFRVFSYESTVNRECYNCGSKLAPLQNTASLFFPCSCGAIQPIPSHVSYFRLFDLNPSIVLDIKDLENRFRDLQRQLHPDKFSKRSRAERVISAENSALVNVAFQVLKKPMERVRYILSTRGIHVLDEASGTAPVDPTILMEIMEVRESLENQLSQADLEIMARNIQAIVDSALEKLADSLADSDIDVLTDQAVRLQYYHKLLEDIGHMRDPS